MTKNSSLAALLCMFLLCACSPKFDWREVRGSDVPYTVLMPAKPASFSRDMQLDGVQFKMQMTGADVDGLSFAVGTAKIEDASKLPAVMTAMKNGMVNNIRGTISSEKPGKIAQSVDVEAHGVLQNGEPVLLVARFASRGPWVYQAVIIGREKALNPEIIDTFMSSFNIN